MVCDLSIVVNTSARLKKNLRKVLFLTASIFTKLFFVCLAAHRLRASRVSKMSPMITWDLSIVSFAGSWWSSASMNDLRSALMQYV